MIENSTKTLSRIKSDFIAHTGESSITEADIIRAMNRFLSIVERAILSNEPHYKKLVSDVISVTSSGYDISNLADIGSDRKGFEVYKNSLRRQNRLIKRSIDSSEEGYYLIGNNLKITPYDKAMSVVIVYRSKTSRLGDDVEFSTQVLPIDQDLEETAMHFLAFVFYDGQYQFDREQDAEARFYEELQRFFNVEVRGTVRATRNY